MKQIYNTPEFSVLHIGLSIDVLTSSIPESPQPTQGVIEEPIGDDF